jgi:hypothetical protein
MGGTRAVIASLGASISIVACAALGLFAVSVLFAYPGIAGSLNGSGSSPTLVVATRIPAPATKAGAKAAVKPLRVSAPVLRTPSKPQTISVKRPASAIVDSPSGSGRTRRPATTSSTADVAAVTAPPASSATVVAKPKVGDGVRELGDTLTGTVQKTGEGVGAVAKPLGPPVSKAVQDVLNLAITAINDLLKKTTGGLAGALDTTTR